MVCIAFPSVEDCVDRVPEPGPLRRERRQRGVAGFGQPVVAPRRSGFGLAPGRGDQLVLAQPGEQRVDGPLAGDQPGALGLRVKGVNLLGKEIRVERTEQRVDTVGWVKDTTKSGRSRTVPLMKSQHGRKSSEAVTGWSEKRAPAAHPSCSKTPGLRSAWVLAEGPAFLA